ncbi:MMPL family transporter [Pseudenhygromyxa sp. WMMC2535]|uniref:MMPL family transporter n=1 Tax=Pseudenhygromyxa sp. WMMC2535 TaxID=2712867 RepID=UPI001555BAA3|nr:MMPL family transporter [Pseudenhygromyxa sp. WMMC2535]NVB41654.1 MMPL family transporter [Pseudenhygromyxa sp. WMMC2535]
MPGRERLDRRRDKFFVAFGSLGVRFPTITIAVLLVLSLAGAALATQLKITTSRFGLVDSDNWYQSRMIAFFDAFGFPDSPVALVEGGTVEQRREVVDRFTDELESEPLFEGRVLGHIGAEDVPEVLLVSQPGAIAELRRSLPPGTDFPSAIEGGLEGIFAMLEAQMLGVLDGEVEVDPSQSDDQLVKLAALARALDAKLAEDAGVGEGPDTEALLAIFAGEGDSPLPSPEDMRARGLDEDGYFVSKSGEHLLVAVFPEFTGDEVEDYAPAVDRLRAIRDGLELPEGMQIRLTGIPLLAVDEQQVLSRGLAMSSAAAGLGIFVLLMWAFRSWRRAMVALLSIGVGTVISLGALYLLYGALDPITSSFAAVLMGLGIDFAVHLLARYDEELRRGARRGEALFTALRFAGPGVVTGAVTTALAFLTVATTEFTSYGQMGVITAIGLMVSLLASLILLPLILGRGDLDNEELPPKPLPAIEFVPRLVRKSPFLILLAGVVLALAGVARIPDYDPRYLDMLPKAWESTEALSTLEQDGAMSPWLAWVTADDLDEARERAEALRGLGSVERVDSPTDMLPALDDAAIAKLRADFDGLERDPDWVKLAGRDPKPADLAKRVQGVVDALDELAFAAEQAGQDDSLAKIRDAKAAFEGLHARLESVPPERGAETLDKIEEDMARLLAPAWATAKAVAARGGWSVEDIPERFARRFVARDGSGRLAVYAYPTGAIASVEGGIEGARQFSEDLESVDPNAAGQGISLYRHNDMIVSGFKRASLFSLCLVLALLLLDFASLRKSLLALFPVLVGMGWMFGVFTLLGMRLNVATIVVIPLILGIGIDAGVHMMHRWEINSRSHHGRARLDEIIRGTGGAIVLSSLTTMVGFAGLLVGQHQGMVRLGGSMVIGIGCTLLASVVVLPALLVLLDRAR